MMRALLLCLLLAGCGRALTGSETALAEDIFGPSLDTSKIRITGDAPMRSFQINLPPRPRVTCQERIVPERTGTVKVTPAGIVAFNRLFLSENWSLEDFAPRYPAAVFLYDIMFFAHEMTHIWQWQNRARTDYHPLKAAAEHIRSEDPYLFDPDRTQPFLDYGYEQQASLVEEYVCCAMLDPEGARTDRLRALISKDIPLGRLPQSRVFVGWPDAPTSGLCS